MPPKPQPNKRKAAPKEVEVVTVEPLAPFVPVQKYTGTAVTRAMKVTAAPTSFMGKVPPARVDAYLKLYNERADDHQASYL